MVSLHLKKKPLLNRILEANNKTPLVSNASGVFTWREINHNRVISIGSIPDFDTYNLHREVNL